MKFSGLNLQKTLVTALLVVCVSQSAFGQLIQDVIAGPGTTCWFLREYGYDCESHKVTTSDGYILNMFRVLCPNANIPQTTTRKVAFLMHGILCSSSIWTISPETGLAMTMCDSGYDVWLGNARGNQYSQEHVTLSPLGPNFYKFSWSEIASIDLPTMMNYTLNYTGHPNLTYVGHSQGTTVYFAMASEDPTLASSLISSAHLLSPVVFTDQLQGLVPALGEPLFGGPDPTSDVIEQQIFLKVLVSDILGVAVCEDADPTQDACQEIIDILSGESNLTNQTVLPDFFVTFPAGSSFRQFKHYLQMKRNSNFGLFNFGTLLNQVKYGSATPPQYALGNINVPTFLYHADSDFLAPVVAVQRLLTNLNPNIVRAVRLYNGYNHFDFIYANNVKQDLHAQVLLDIDSV